jgi:hypothetical protein
MDLIDLPTIIVLCSPAPIALYWWLTYRQERKRRRVAEKSLLHLQQEFASLSGDYARLRKADAVLDAEIIS